jgi:GT2 family glycosyltransferase
MVQPDPRVSIVVISRNRRDELLENLGRLTRMPEAPSIVVVDNGSTDGSASAVAQLFPSIKLITSKNNLGAAGRNLGVAHTATPYVAFCDNDSWPESDHLRRAADVLDAHPRLAILSGRVLVGPENVEDPICQELEQSPVPVEPGMPGPPLLGFLAGASMVRRSAFLAAGGFEQRLQVGGEEELLAVDLAASGWWVCYDREYTVHHHPSPRRSHTDRRAKVVRNALWAAWLRRSRRGAVRRTAWLASRWKWDRVTTVGVLNALAGLPWVLRNRRVVPQHVEAALEALDAQSIAGPPVSPITA